MELIDEFAQIVLSLQAAKIEFAVCGGIAMAVHGLPRYTKDIDLLVPVGDLERAVTQLKNIGFDYDAGLVPLASNQARRISKIVGQEYLTLDLLLVDPSLEKSWRDRIVVEWNSLRVPVVSASGLARMKRIAGRLQDLADIERLGFNLDDPAIQP